MPDIRYVIVSDMHLGAENSILTNLVTGTYQTDTTIASPVMIKMVECLRDIIQKNEGSQKPTLVLNGDLVELALTTTNNAAMAFERFLELAMPENGQLLFDNDIFFLSGNHDHNLWERSRNYGYIEYLKTLQKGEAIKDEIHSTDMFNPQKVPENLLNALVQRYPHLRDVNVFATYPAHAILSEDKQKCVIFCHGHYVESMYSLMTSLRSKIFPDRLKPQTFEELEMENYAWVDFFWSTLGRSGAVGKDIDLIYDKIQDPSQVKMMIHNIALSFTDSKRNKILNWAEKELLQEILMITVGRLATNERSEPEVVLTPDASAGLKQYMELFVMNQFKKELGDYVPPNVSFVFGHTHKPFQQLITYEGYKTAVKIYNSGGWVVDTMKQQPLHGGSVILVDEHFDVVVLQMYKEGKYNITVEELQNVNEESCEFYKKLNSVIDMQSEPWSGFAKIVAEEVI
ncbi:MAG: metallophosphoesterase, partial [Chitinophagaceae bacterium]